jgi:hypothetical protein
VATFDQWEISAVVMSKSICGDPGGVFEAADTACNRLSGDTHQNCVGGGERSLVYCDCSCNNRNLEDSGGGRSEAKASSRLRAHTRV